MQPGGGLAWKSWSSCGRGSVLYVWKIQGAIQDTFITRLLPDILRGLGSYERADLVMVVSRGERVGDCGPKAAECKKDSLLK